VPEATSITTAYAGKCVRIIRFGLKTMGRGGGRLSVEVILASCEAYIASGNCGLRNLHVQPRNYQVKRVESRE
jgi:hypothetical protein